MRFKSGGATNLPAGLHAPLKPPDEEKSKRHINSGQTRGESRTDNPQRRKSPWPSISSQLKNQFTRFALISTNITGRTCPIPCK